MAAFNKFQPWVEYMVEGANVGTDQFAVALTAAANAPVNTNGVIADLTQIAYTNLSSRNLTTASSAQSGGTQSVTFADLTLTASGGAAAAFRYVVIYDDTVVGDPLVGWYDYGSDLTLADGESLLIDFTGAAFTIT